MRTNNPTGQDQIILHSSLADVSPDLAQKAEFPSFPAKIGVVVRANQSSSGYRLALEQEWPTLTALTRGLTGIPLADLEEETRLAIYELAGRCQELAEELTRHAAHLFEVAAGDLIHGAERLEGRADTSPVPLRTEGLSKLTQGAKQEKAAPASASSRPEVNTTSLLAGLRDLL
jgi:hypothetical protein